MFYENAKKNITIKGSAQNHKQIQVIFKKNKGKLSIEANLLKNKETVVQTGKERAETKIDRNIAI